MTSGNASTVYLSVVEDVLSKVRKEFITCGAGDAVLNELQALWETKLLHSGAISGNIDRNRASPASAGGATPPVHDLNVPYEATSEDQYATPTVDMLFPPTPLQTPIQTPLSGGIDTAGMYDIPTGPWEYAPSPIGMGMMNGGDDEPPLNEDDDDDDDDTDDFDETQHLVLAQFDKITRTKNRWKCTLKDGIMHLNGRDVLFHKASGEFDF